MFKVLLATLITVSLVFGGRYLVHYGREDAVIVPEVKEELNAIPLRVEGTLPEWLSGILVRNGPVSVSVNGRRVDHWLDGLAMVHSFRFDKGKVDFSNRFLRTGAYRQVFDYGSLDYTSFASDPTTSLWNWMIGFLRPKGDGGAMNPNVNVYKMADQYVALTETPLPVRFDLTSLETLGALKYTDDLPKEDCFDSAHPHHDLGSGDVINYLVEYGRASHYVLYRVRDKIQREVIDKIPVETPSYMHTFALTENYIVLTEYPLVVNPLSFLMSSKAFIHHFQWKPDLGTVFLVYDRRDKKVVGRYKTESFFCFHHANAYDKDGHIIIDLIQYKDASLISQMAEKFIKEVDEEPSKLMRYDLELATGRLTPSVIYDKSMEFPRINDAKVEGRPYNYVYCAGWGTALAQPLYKVDVTAKTAVTWSQPDCAPGEPIFIGKPNSQSEDDGIVVSLVNDLKAIGTFLLVLDASTFKEIARIKVPIFIPEPLHAQFYGRTTHAEDEG